MGGAIVAMKLDGPNAQQGGQEEDQAQDSSRSILVLAPNLPKDEQFEKDLIVVATCTTCDEIY